MRYIIFLSLVVMACGGESVPKQVLAPEKMKEVMYDMIRADEMIDILRYSDSTYQPFSKRTALYDTIFGLHGVTKEAVQKSLRYYQGRPDLLKEMMNELHANVTDTTHKPKPEAIH